MPKLDERFGLTPEEAESITLDELCNRKRIPRDLIERYLRAIGKAQLLSERQIGIHWHFLVEDLPAFHAYLAHNKMNRSDRDIAARADRVTAEVWRCAHNATANRGRLKQKLKRIGERLVKLRNLTSDDERGESVNQHFEAEKFPYWEAKHELEAATEKVRPGRPPTISEAVALIETMISLIPGPGRPPGAAMELTAKLASDHFWLTGKHRSEHSSNFGEFVEAVLDGKLRQRLGRPHNVSLATILGYQSAKKRRPHRA